jgi:transcriptional regulator with XRE-family HTH domain
MCAVRKLVFPNRAELARLMSLDTSTLDKIEKGTRAPSIFNVMEFANRCRVSTDYLLRGLPIGVDAELLGSLLLLHPELMQSPLGTDTPPADFGMPSLAAKATPPPS